MKFKKHEPLNLSLTSLDAPTDNDLDLPSPASPPQPAPIELASSTPLSPPPATTATASDEARTPVLMNPAPEPKAAAPAKAKSSGRAIYTVAGVGSVLWAALAIFAIGFQWPVGTVEFAPFQIAIYVVLALAPIGLIWVLAFGVRQGERLATEVGRTRTLADEMLQPAVVAASESGSVVEDVRRQIEAATSAAAEARNELLHLREILAEETGRLTQAAAESARTAHSLHETLGGERAEMSALSIKLDSQAASVVDAVSRQARMVAEASDLAQTQIGEAEAGLAARAADLAAAAGEASDAARIASEDLARQTVRLETVSVAVGDQGRAVEDALSQQRAGLVTVAHGLRADHEEFSVRLESQQAQVAEMLVKAREAIGELNGVTLESAASMRDLSASTQQHFMDLADTAKAERDQIAAAALQSLGAVSEAARYEREQMESGVRDGVAAMAEAAEDAHKLAAAQSETARLKIEQLSEAAFEAGQKADAAYQARLADAQALISHSAGLVDEAAAAAAMRLERTMAGTSATFAELEQVIAAFEERTARLPDEAKARAEELKVAIAQGFDDLLDSARKAAEETQAIDAAFQGRVKRNYEMLSEAVRLMGVVGSPAASAASAAYRSPAPRPLAAEPPARREAEPAPAPRPVPAPEPTASGLRLRLKLAPTAADQEISQVFDTTAEAAGGAGEGWSWQDLLTSMDDEPLADDQLADRIIGEVEAVGADPAALLPPQRIEEIATILRSGDVPAARQMVKRLAPAAVRRLSRRILAERPLRSHADRYIQRYETVLNDALKRGPGGEGFAALLATDEGRAFLLFDAAIGDLH
jgi:hypothetical protein